MTDASTLDAAPERMSREAIVAWWEKRRLRYNVWVGSVGIVTWLLVLIAGSAAVKPGVDFEEPIAMIIGPFVYAGFANFFYTLGWIFDIVFFKASPRQWLFQAGLIFSAVLTAAPGVWALTAWLITLHTGQKFD